MAHPTAQPTAQHTSQDTAQRTAQHSAPHAAQQTMQHTTHYYTAEQTAPHIARGAHTAALSTAHTPITAHITQNNKQIRQRRGGGLVLFPSLVSKHKKYSHALREQVSVSVKVGERGLDLVDLLLRF